MPRLLTAATVALALSSGLSAQGDEAKRIRDSIVVLSELIGAADKEIPKSVLQNAQGVAVFPSLLKGGFIIGGQRGHGVLSVRKGKSTEWSSPAFLTITGGSFGLQIGGQAVDLVLVVNNQRGLEQLVANQFKIGADASVAAGPVGRDAGVATDIQMRAQIFSYSRTRGVFAGMTINGSTISQDRDANERFYGLAYRTRQIVFDGLGGAPDPVGEWKAALSQHAARH
jgi:lipid-binding SYLF domain-containing protein